MANLKRGQQVMTCGINNAIAEDSKFAKEIIGIMERYSKCDWGELDEEDKLTNDNALIHADERIFASYKTSLGRVFVITEWDRSATTILFANEY